MLQSEALSRVYKMVNDTTGTGIFDSASLYQFLDSGMNLIIDIAVHKLESKRKDGDIFYRPLAIEPLSLLDTTNTTTTGSGLQEYSLTTTYLITDYAEYDSAGTTNRKPAVLKNFAEILFEMQRTYDLYTADNPAYYIRADKIGFFPQPTGGGANAYNHYYYSRPAPIASGTSGNEIPLRRDVHEAIIFFAYSFAMLKDNRPEEANIAYKTGMELIKNYI